MNVIEDTIREYAIREACGVNKCVEDIKREYGDSIPAEELAEKLLQLARKIVLRENMFSFSTRYGIELVAPPIELAMPHFDYILKLCPNSDYFKEEICSLISGMQWWMAEREGKLEEAIEYNQKIIKINPDDSMAYYNIGVYKAYQDGLKEALTYFHKAIENKPDYAEAWANLASIYFHFKDYVQSLLCVEKAKKYKSPYPAMDNLIAQIEEIDFTRESNRPCLEKVTTSDNEALWEACKARDVEKVKVLLEKGVDVDARKDGETPLIWVSSDYSDEWYEIAGLLMAYGADINASDKYGTPLIEAIHGDNVAMVKLLLNNGVDIRKVGPNGGKNPLYPLEYARDKGNNEIISLLEQAMFFRDKLKDGSFGPEMVVIRAGQFKMGDDNGNSVCYGKPEHQVTIAYDFAMGKYLVTFDEYDLFCQATGRKELSDNNWGRGKRPVIGIYQPDAKDYCQWLSEQTGRQYRLPTEAEWEYTCRAGTTTSFSFGDNDDDLSQYAWHWSNSDKKTHPVGEKKPNPWGLYDMHGNVWELCEDIWNDDYEGAPTDGSAWLSGGEWGKLVWRGGWRDNAYFCRSAFRNWISSKESDARGFRLCCSL